MSKEILKLLTANAIRWDRSPGGKPTLTGPDVAAMLARVPDSTASLFARAKYCDDLSGIDIVETAIIIQLVQRLKERPRKLPRPGWLRSMVRLAIVEEISPGICPVCHGRGQIKAENVIYKCASCHGVKFKGSSIATQAKAMRIRRQVWEKWRAFYEQEVLRILQDYQYQVSRALKETYD